MVYYDDKNHAYYVNGIQVPSVTQMLHYLFPNKYKGVSSEVLSNKANYGTEIHNLVEKVNNLNITNPLDVLSLECSDGKMKTSIINYINIKNKYKFEVLKQELIVYNNYVAGRFDILSRMNNKKCLMDIKTTSSLDKEYLSWQLSLYDFLNQEDKAEELYAIWMPKSGDVSLHQINFKTKEEIISLITNYYHFERGEKIEF